MKKILFSFPKQSGFTLVEIVLVIALIGITGTLLISLVNPAQQFKKSNDARRKADVRQLQTVFELYRNDQGEYPPEPLPDCGSPLTGGTMQYIQKLPCDPKNGTAQFKYNYTSPTASTYTIVACLENLSDPQKDPVNALNPLGGTYCDGTTAWSYTLINP